MARLSEFFIDKASEIGYVVLLLIIKDNPMDRLEIAFYLTAFTIVTGVIILSGILLTIISGNYLKMLGV